MDDGEEFWQNVAAIAANVRKNAPEGLTQALEIRTRDGETYRPSTVQRKPPWILFSHVSVKSDEGHEIVIVREEEIERIKIFWEPMTKRSVGFSMGEVGLD